MPRIPEQTIERVKDANDIVEVVGEYVQLRKSGRNFSGLCPFHNEKTPSFSVNPDLQIYKCFGCGVGGSVFKFIQEIDRVSFVEAVSFLARRKGIAIDRENDTGETQASDRLYQANALGRKYFHYMLAQSQGRRALDYLQRRGVADEIVERFGLGYAPSGRTLLEMAGRRGFKAEELVQAGLVSANQERREYYDRFRDRLVFPIANLSGRTIAFGARALKDEQQPKYLNSSESPIYHKSSVLYGLDQTRDAIRRLDCALIVEGYMDLLSLVQHGVEHVVASSGTALTREHCRALGRYAQRVVVVFDGDAAGSAAARRGLEMLVAAGIDARVLSLPPEHDPDSFVQAEGGQAFTALVDEAGSALDFLMQDWARSWDLTTVDGKARAAEAVKPLLISCADPVRRDLLLREVVGRLGLEEKSLRQQLQQRRRGNQRQRHSQSVDEAPGETVEVQIGPAPEKERAFFGLLLNHPRFIEPTAASLRPDSFADSRSQRLAQLLFDQYRQASKLDPALLTERIEDRAVADFILDCAMESFDADQVEQSWRDSIRTFQTAALDRRFQQVVQAWQQSMSAGDEAAQARLSKQMMELLRAKQQLSSAPQA
ncbi:MAG: DNA primase [Candidatus Latescibacteria bacterium]|nr:DNA primase [Candidatus Latescibacterota bacterium]